MSDKNRTDAMSFKTRASQTNGNTKLNKFDNI